MKPLFVDETRSSTETGIYVRAMVFGKYETVDISMLDKESLLAWLRSRGGENHFAEDCVGILLGHGRLN